MARDVTRKVTSAPRAKRPWKAMANAICSTRSIARPARVAMKAGGVDEHQPRQQRREEAEATASAPTTTPAA